MAKKIIIVLFILSVLFLGFAIGRYTNLMSETKASWAAKSNAEFKELDDSEKALALAIAAASPNTAKEMVKYMKAGNVSKDAVQSIITLTRGAGADKGMGPQQQGPQKPQTFEEEMAAVKDFKVSDKSFVSGDKKAPIQIVLFTEFLCPFCKRVEPVIDKLAKEYGKKVSLTFQSKIIHGEKAEYWHRVAYAAGKQGKFWETEKYLFDNQSALQQTQPDQAWDSVVVPMCQKLGLKADKVKKDMDSDEIKSQIKSEDELATGIGVRGTPTVAINGRIIRGAKDEEYFKKAIEYLLQNK